MDNLRKIIYEVLKKWVAALSRPHFLKKRGGGEPPLKAELFSIDQMKQHGGTLAGLHQVTCKTSSDRLLARLKDNANVLTKIRELLSSRLRVSGRIAPAEEWLLDNFYLIEEQIYTAKRHLPEGYSRQLPRLATGLSATLPRVYDIALEMISHGDGRVDPESLGGFVASYQKIAILRLGELWAIPIMLRLALIENLRRVGTRIVADRIDKNLADSWVDQMIEVSERDPKSLMLVVADMARSDPPMSASFVAGLVRRLQEHNIVLPLNWIKQWLSEAGLTIKQLVQSDNQQQASDQISISNSIGSLQLLRMMDWREFVETNSVVEQVLREEPNGTYPQMDFATRDRYRHAVESIAKNSAFSEESVARKALEWTHKGQAERNDAGRAAHVGYYLIGKGVPLLERSVGMSLSIQKSVHRMATRSPLILYLCAIGLGMGLIAIHLLRQVYAAEIPGWAFLSISFLTLLLTSQSALELVNRFVTLWITPRLLPRMDLSDGIPPELRTLVVVPAMLINPRSIEALAESLEVRFLSNQDENLRYALLTDLQDAFTETLDEDGPLVSLAEKMIRQLNKKYGGAKGDVFFLFHRPRLWNVREKIWMGYERKRGKLGDLNSFLCGGSGKSFSLIVGDTACLSGIKYVITLDTDTQLPRGSARQMVGTMAHPLNHPHYDEIRGRVTEGYAILQPRVSVSFPGASLSPYVKLHAGEAGIDPYTRTVSDVYQDVFHEGSFIGKGIYDLQMFERVLKGRFPEGQILSHDLLEGCYLRSGLLSDVQLYEEYPSRYDADISRRYRWIRGDWQLVRWLFSSVRNMDRHRQKNPISGLSQWKLFDNIRRSAVPVAQFFLMVIGWAVLPSPGFWTLSVLGVLLIPTVISLLLETFQKPDDVQIRRHLGTIVSSAARRLGQALFAIACLPYEAFLNLDAIVRTAVRMMMTHKRLLEWSISNAHDQRKKSIVSYYRLMWTAPLIMFITAIYLMALRADGLMVAGPLLLLWGSSPGIAWWMGRPYAHREIEITASQSLFLRSISRKTWAFFESFVGPNDHWLPPDNYQENRPATLAHRTSPTNIGLSLLANLSAYDFGYIGVGVLLERTANTLRTLGTLKRYQGHFYNWYDTQTLKPLVPGYISTVDSGNLAANLLTLRQGLLALADAAILRPRVLEGLSDTAEVLLSVLGGYAPEPLVRFQKALESALKAVPGTLISMRSCMEVLAKHAADVAAHFSLEENSQNHGWGKALDVQCRMTLGELDFFGDFSNRDSTPTLRELCGAEAIGESRDRARNRLALIEHLVFKSGEYARMDYAFLYDETQHLLAIGYNVDERRRDPSYYDLLASEARLCTFVSIAQEQVPQENWFALGRLLTNVDGDSILLSWSGSMFEYLMPLLLMPSYPNTLLHQTCKVVVKKQIKYGRQSGVPWGVSESGYNAVDTSFNYQYRAFGVPGLGLKRRLAEDLVIAPYATLLALMVDPGAACLNLQRLASEGLLGKFGFYEAIDYTPSRRSRDGHSVVLRSHLAHHQGMGLLSLASVLLGPLMQKRFESEPSFQATLLLLQERVPKAASFYAHTTELPEDRVASDALSISPLVFKDPDTPVPEVQLLSNGTYHVMVTNAGGGYSRWKDLAVTRWREDSTCDSWGAFCYIRDVVNGEFWSTAYQPTLKQPKNYEAIFSEGRAEFHRRDRDIDTRLEIVVSPEDDVELRRVRLINRSRIRKTIDVTSYAEVVLASWASDALHPVFSNLFVQTEIIGRLQSILCARRPRSANEETPWMFHLMTVHGTEIEAVSYETDRAKFIGRGNTLVDPNAMKHVGPLSGTQGSVLDPVVAIRCQISVEPGQSVSIDMVSGMGQTREMALSLAEKYHDRRLADRILELAWTHSQVVLRQINATESDTRLYRFIANSILYANASLRVDPHTLIKNRKGQPGLWGYAISGDLPIVLVQIKEQANIELVRQMVQAFTYWRLKGLSVDLVIWNEDRGGYQQSLHEQIVGLIIANAGEKSAHRSGGIFVRSSEQISDEDRLLFQSVARVILRDDRGKLEAQIRPQIFTHANVQSFFRTRNRNPKAVEVDVGLRNRELIYFNGLGGFTPDGREYVIILTPGKSTPLPWVNVIANPHFGTVISESASAYTWSENAHEFRLTPWSNDPVGDAGGEAIYLRDEDNGYFWSPAPMPSRGSGSYVVRHGFGYSVFEHLENGIYSELCVYVALDAAVKFSVLKIRNQSGRARRVSATGYVEWVLGDLRQKTAMHITTEVDPDSGTMVARNSYSTGFGQRVAFFDVSEANRTVSGDRTEFIGRNGTLRHPAAMKSLHLSGKVGAGMDPCGAIQVSAELADGQEREIVFVLGAGSGTEDARALAHRFREVAASRQALEAVWNYWNHTLSAVRIETPDPSLNVLANGWLVYQTLACRLWGRSAFYQSGGAYGFRDQLQDVTALLHAQPQLVREHLLLCASRQFQEGDVQHWWHPPTGQGVRTRCSDDYLWLPWVACRYVLSSGDTGILDEPVHFLSGRPVNPEEDSYYNVPAVSETTASFYEHCTRAILRGLSFGEHGLPLMGSGDWNDGMNLVGIHGKGESVWLGFFLYEVLTQFMLIAKIRQDTGFADRCQQEAARLRGNLQQHGWDGDWYRRAYFDDGTPLGSASNSECKIDSVPQSWSVLSGASDKEYSQRAMMALDRHLIHRDSGVIQLLAPPFDRSNMNPGYIKGYVPGVRENGGQYSHAAVWAAMAFAALGNSKHAWELMNLMNPVRKGDSGEGVSIYKVEPYVVAADVYATIPHTGRGGWTWYTGSAGCMYRLIVEYLLGLRLSADRLHLSPCLPADWKSLKIDYRYRQTVYRIHVLQSDDGDSGMTVDGLPCEGMAIPLIDDGRDHAVEARIAVTTDSLIQPLKV